MRQSKAFFLLIALAACGTTVGAPAGTLACASGTVLAAVAVGWTLLPMFVLPVCGAM